MLGDTEVAIACFSCGQRNVRTLDWIRAGEPLACSGCGRLHLLNTPKVLAALQHKFAERQSHDMRLRQG